MCKRFLIVVVTAAGVCALGAGTVLLAGPVARAAYALRAADEHAPFRVIVENRTYSGLVVAAVDSTGGERRLGHAPPDFTNTLFVSEPLPRGPVRLTARVAGEEAVLFRSDVALFQQGRGLRWRLPANAIDPFER